MGNSAGGAAMTLTRKLTSFWIVGLVTTTLLLLLSLDHYRALSALLRCGCSCRDLLLSESGLALHRAPAEPSTQLLQENGRGFPPGYLHESWRDFLYWDSELDQG